MGAVSKRIMSIKGFERIATGCPVPIVIAGGKLPEREALEMCYQAIDGGFWRMGRNILFRSEDPVAR